MSASLLNIKLTLVILCHNQTKLSTKVEHDKTHWKMSNVSQQSQSQSLLFKVLTPHFVIPYKIMLDLFLEYMKIKPEQINKGSFIKSWDREWKLDNRL